MMMVSLVHLLSTPAARLLIIFSAFYLLTIYYIRTYTTAALTPGSHFFSPSKAFQNPYSSYREQVGTNFITAASTSTIPSPPSPSLDTSPRTLCLGFPSINRPVEQYFPAMLGSLLANLSYTDRKDLYIMPLIAHVDPYDHPFYNTTWLPKLSDRVLLYDTLDNATFEHVQGLEKERRWGLKEMFDYAYLLEECLGTETPYIGIIEDDTVAVEGWYGRVTEALDLVEEGSGVVNGGKEWLYLRMFYTEEYLGWNSEEWGTYGFNIFLAYAIPISCLFAARYFTGARYSVPVLLVVFAYCLPLVIVLVFLKGRPPLDPGVREMNRYGCCTQGMVFPREIVPRVIEYLRSLTGGFLDLRLEEFADREELSRWVAVPSILQHVGGRGTRGDDMENGKYGMSVSEITWSVGFERYKPGGKWSGLTG